MVVGTEGNGLKTMDLTIFDHILVATLFLVIPVFSVTDYRKLESRLDAGLPTARLLFYRSIIAWSWGLAVAVAALWLVRADSRLPSSCADCSSRR